MKTKVTTVILGEEVEIGVFNQGVVFDFDKDLSLGAPTTLRDVASGAAIARVGSHGGTWRIEWPEAMIDLHPDIGISLARIPMDKLFIQGA